jgi:hypothetical protein
MDKIKYHPSIFAFQDSFKRLPFNPTYAKDFTDKIMGAKAADHNEMSERDWFGDSYKNCLDILERESWPEGVKRAKHLSSEIVLPKVKSVRRKRTRSDLGSEIDMARVYSSQLSTAWSDTTRESSAGKRQITISASIGFNCATSASAFFWRGATALKLVELMTDAGYRVRVLGFSAARDVDYADRSKVFADVIQLKAFNQRVNLTALAIPLCLPAFFRLKCFESRMKDPDIKDGSYSLGGTVKKLPEGFDADIQIESIKSKDQAINFIQKQLGKIGA